MNGIQIGYRTAAGVAGGGSQIEVARGYVTTGNTTLANVGSTWTVIAALDDFAIPAAVGDVVEFQASFLARLLGTNFIDQAVLVGGAPVRYASSGTATPAVQGDPCAYREATDNFVRGLGPFGFTVTADDLEGGEVTFGIAYSGTGTTSVVHSEANYPFRWRAYNFGPPA